eukprot:CAMPEP_0182453682 /NCGR_PEP_ID=MMETSP1319-20130603/646_1 /TAXON_ID=172717 /ORGANISM="Bolidomonas pacifica, Strain RCC208" /LENGTH=107 /DNA_ID=CAMNT_0024651635 /DNA_START=351 /DNA_END=674 /DNA_ORIENTATION=+
MTVVTPSPARVKDEKDTKFQEYHVPNQLKAYLVNNEERLRLKCMASKYRTEFLLQKFSKWLTRSSPNHRLVMRQTVKLWRGRGVRYDSPQFGRQDGGGRLGSQFDEV